MNTITHALLPVIAASLVERVDRGAGRKGRITTRQILIIGLFGAAPDVINPHLSLSARYSSWSHSVPFWIGLTVAMVVASLFSRKRFPPGMVIWFSLAYLLHLFCDLVAGGIAWLYPWSREVVGQYYVPPQWWAWIDGICILIIYGVWRIVPHFHRSQEREI